MTTYQTKYSGNKYWNNILLHDEQTVQSDVPVVTTDSLHMLWASDANAQATIVTIGDSDLTSYGFVWATHSSPTLSDHVVEVGTSNITGVYTRHIGGFGFGSTVYVAAYATNNDGTAYGNTLSGMPQICLAAGTLISLPDGSEKKIENVQYSDRLLVWNFDMARLDAGKTLWMVRPFSNKYHGLVRFSDGSELRTVADGKGHRIFNMDAGMFTHLMHETTPVGTRTLTKSGKVIFVTKKEIVHKPTTFYNVISDRHINVFANGILTSTGLNNLYPITDMKFAKEDRQLRSREEFSVPERIYTGLRLAEQPIGNYPGLLKQKIHFMLSRQW